MYDTIQRRPNTGAHLQRHQALLNLLIVGRYGNSAPLMRAIIRDPRLAQYATRDALSNDTFAILHLNFMHPFYNYVSVMRWVSGWDCNNDLWPLWHETGIICRKSLHYNNYSLSFLLYDFYEGITIMTMISYSLTIKNFSKLNASM